MTTREDKLKKLNAELEQLTDDELEQVAGGTFTPNDFTKDTYEVCGIKVVEHFFAKDEFWYKGKNIGHNDANAVVTYVAAHQKQPENLEQARAYYKGRPKETVKPDIIVLSPTSTSI